MSAWDPARYLQFSDLRTRPAAELLARVPVEDPTRVVDLGCGPGNSTALLAERWPTAEIAGIDGSDEMIRRARADNPALHFRVADITEWQPDEPVDVLFANAALHWIPNHVDLLPRLLGHVAPGGALALQVPNNFDRPAHTEAHRIVRESFPDLDGILPDRPVYEAQAHYDALAAEGVVVDVWQTEYLQPLTGPDPIVAWTSGTFLRPLLTALADAPDRKAAFLAEYSAAMRHAHPPRPEGVTLLPFPRLFAIAKKGDGGD
ncbi:MAG: methyltransferase domain-containing protein [Deltaproteobacteria bacterium]|jgi:trans-aconitate 2-methyltransferase|nr:methyltransferase domain-containing protein [Deltaproteobacteria bacterium]MBW2530027.1 methyltransferase domain-containing protein [Deltaproteobacteria bacterium]